MSFIRMLICILLKKAKMSNIVNAKGFIIGPKRDGVSEKSWYRNREVITGALHKSRST